MNLMKTYTITILISLENKVTIRALSQFSSIDIDETDLFKALNETKTSNVCGPDNFSSFQLKIVVFLLSILLFLIS